MNRLLRPTIVAVGAVGALAALTSAARAEVEIGGTAGIHVFAHDNELGVADIPNADSERNSALFGLRLGVFFTPMFGVEGELGLIPSESRQTTFDVWNIAYRAQFVRSSAPRPPTSS